MKSFYLCRKDFIAKCLTFISQQKSVWNVVLTKFFHFNLYIVAVSDINMFLRRISITDNHCVNDFTLSEGSIFSAVSTINGYSGFMNDVRNARVFFLEWLELKSHIFTWNRNNNCAYLGTMEPCSPVVYEVPGISEKSIKVMLILCPVWALIAQGHCDDPKPNCSVATLAMYPLGGFTCKKPKFLQMSSSAWVTVKGDHFVVIIKHC